MHHIVVISDIHLCQLEPGEDLWMRYRQQASVPDRAIASMIDALLAEVAASQKPAGDERPRVTLVLNGDIFDFDAPRVEGGRSIFHDDPRDEEHSVPLTEAILDDHPGFVDAVARVLAEGHSLLFISGNHDAQMTLPGVRDVIRRRIVDAAARRSGEARAALAERILFRAWFHLTAEGVLLEHGSQYDPYCSFHYPMDPHHRETRRVQPTLGSLATRLMTSRMGYFNPHVDVTYELSGSQYVAHWIRHYIGSKHSLLFSWFFGSLQTFFHLAGARDHGSEARYRANLEAAAAETGLPKEKLKEHAALFAPPIELAELHRVARELWQDRILFGLVSIAWAVLWLLFVPHRFAVGALAAVAAFVVYESVTPKIRVRDRWQKVDERAADVARVHGARAVVFGHTHHPHASWEGDLFIGNAGSWSASFFDIECTQPVFPERPLVWLKANGDHIEGGLVAWTGTAFKPLVVREPAVSPKESRDPGVARPVGSHFNRIESIAP
jgi:UDP-2,3-diacylglucosamine pyrophosphatase LpxH